MPTEHAGACRRRTPTEQSSPVANSPELCHSQRHRRCAHHQRTHRRARVHTRTFARVHTHSRAPVSITENTSSRNARIRVGDTCGVRVQLRACACACVRARARVCVRALECARACLCVLVCAACVRGFCARDVWCVCLCVCACVLWLFGLAPFSALFYIVPACTWPKTRRCRKRSPSRLRAAAPGRLRLFAHPLPVIRTHYSGHSYPLFQVFVSLIPGFRTAQFDYTAGRFVAIAKAQLSRALPRMVERIRIIANKDYG
jgi:hypothetical protein